MKAGAASKRRVGLVQMSCSEDTGANVDKALAMSREAAKQGAEIVCLPELFRSRYFCQAEDVKNFALAEPIPGPTSEAFVHLAAELDVTLIVSLFERRAPGLFHNTALTIDGKRGLAGKYLKMHIPDDPRFYEKFYFTPGDLGFQSVATRPAHVGVLVCWDQWYPEAARLTALKGADILFYPTAIGWQPEEKATHGERQQQAWEIMQRSHAVANGCYVVAVNRTGFEPDPSGRGGIEFWGQSFIAGPDGAIVVKAPADEELVMVRELDLAQLEVSRTGWPFLRDRRIDAYGDITRRFLDD